MILWRVLAAPGAVVFAAHHHPRAEIRRKASLRQIQGSIGELISRRRLCDGLGSYPRVGVESSGP
jgi:hypothetical protein